MTLSSTKTNPWPSSKLGSANAWSILIFLYFFTLVCDQIYWDISSFRLKLSHIVGVTTLLLFVFQQKKMRMPSSFLLLSFSLLISILISSFFSPNASKSAFYAVVWAFIFTTYFILPFNLMKQVKPNKIISLYTTSYLLLGSYALCQVLFSIIGITLPFSAQTLIYVRGSAFAQEPSFYAMYAIPIVAFLNAKFLLSRGLRLFLKKHPSRDQAQTPLSYSWKNIFILIFSNLCLLASTASTAILGYIAFILILLFTKFNTTCKPYTYKIRSSLIKLFCLIGSILFAFWGAVGHFIQASLLKFLFFGIQSDSFQVRFQGIVKAFNLFCHYPLFGVGLGGTGPYLYNQLFAPEHTEQVSEIDKVALQFFDPTNILTEVLSCLGLLGLSLFLMLIFYIFKLAKKAINLSNSSHQEKINALSLFISIIVMLITMQVNQGLFRSYVWVHLGLSVGYFLYLINKYEPITSRH